MKIENIDLTETTLLMYQHIVDQCKKIINENLQINGGTLKISDIFEKNYNWTNLIVSTLDNEISV